MINAILKVVRCQQLMQMYKQKLTLLIGRGALNYILLNELKKEFEIEAVIIEDSVPLSTFLKRRLAKLGFFKVVGQLSLVALALPFIKKSSNKRIDNILREHNLDVNLTPADNIKYVESVNSQTCLDLISKLKSDLIVVNGTRIISKKVLNSINVPIINTHLGITPQYRGVHGGYWALVNGDDKNIGVTVHKIDAGIDTCEVILQSSVDITIKDTFATYPYLQQAKGTS